MFADKDVVSLPLTYDINQHRIHAFIQPLCFIINTPLIISCAYMFIYMNILISHPEMCIGTSLCCADLVWYCLPSHHNVSVYLTEEFLVLFDCMLVDFLGLVLVLDGILECERTS